ncbi:Uncharacterised protein [[Clostridium] sordellii]|uniref:Uncharacterized protein n=1 Tax=Paraclostridium sordellii TaxID=1505 RepID=A0ABP1XT08_PARSO|nr:hypothetical protein [Paeniclostridium sordellii]EPZ54759.1 hypothetical protein H477_3900 [[Clostridium] sordellii ATCC 9714] [Paeniclostridium sordellii ATCC 9714]CEJ74262.1 hypothetical protein ATCC9714_21501 [[Clostridium] sordellii] [Paeniclostridium sordellii]CEN69804.1 Uncharacterised protein [[Clostridium] sordellii] [Paeniclostridium sordellii]CEN73072.1 Uncharacterised protein [[Clostridium] sordellii] [Paeniclostridium sordellii]CEP75335.1 Uncharacterised protein [[Clostridium] s
MIRVLYFDKINISRKEIIENINYYKYRSSEGIECISKKNYKEAKKILKELRKALKKEIKYYNKREVKEIIRLNKNYRIYHWGIVLAYSKSSNSRLKGHLYNNLFGIWDSVSNHDMCMFLEYKEKI